MNRWATEKFLEMMERHILSLIKSGQILIALKPKVPSAYYAKMGETYRKSNTS